MKYILTGAETERLHFREVGWNDFDDWVAFFHDPASFKHWKVERKDPVEECKEWYANQFNRFEMDLGGMSALIEKSSGKLAGHCGLLVQQVDGVRELEIAYSLLPDFRNKGLATEAASKCRDEAFLNRYSSTLVSIISESNVSSVGVARKVGMQIWKQTVYKGNSVYIYRTDLPIQLLVSP